MNTVRSGSENNGVKNKPAECVWSECTEKGEKMKKKIETWETSENDAFQLSIKDWVYYFAVDAAVNRQGFHYYKQNKRTHDIVEVDQAEIVDLVKYHRDDIFKMCPCVEIDENGRLAPLVILEEQQEKKE